MSSRQQKLEAALRVARATLQDNLAEIIWLDQMHQIDDALATPPASEWNEAIDEAATVAHILADRPYSIKTKTALYHCAKQIRALKRKERT